MDVYNSTITDFLSTSKTTFVVPVYQRNYDWLDINCRQLYRDIMGCIRTGNDHFLGTIFFKGNTSREKEIIDGQQRITSLSLLLLALSEATESEDIRNEIRDEYLTNKGHSIDTEYLKTKLHLNKQDDAVYHVVLNNRYEDAADLLTVIQRNSAVYKNYCLFYQWIREYMENGGHETDIQDAMDKLTIILLEIQNENPQEIFESLNSTGMSLTNIDLLRNWFLMRFPHSVQAELYENYWSLIENNVGPENMDTFFSDYLIFRKHSDAIAINGKKEHISEKNLYIAFKMNYSQQQGSTDEEKTRNCFADLLQSSKLYKTLVFRPDFNFAAASDLRKKLYMLLEVNDSTKARCLILYLLDLKFKGKITEEMLATAVNIISSYVFRIKLCNGGNITRQFDGNVMQRLEEITDYSQFISFFWQAITSGNGRYAFPSDNEFRTALVEKNVYTFLRSRGTKYLLYELEMHAPYKKAIQPFDTDTITVEHIMPQKLNTDWKNSLSSKDLISYKDVVHNLGNLTLTNYNSEMSNKSFEEKEKNYINSGFYYTRKVADEEQWNCESIQKRSEQLAKQALLIWSLPQGFQTDSTAKIHSLSEDTGNFTYKKPRTIQMGNQVIYVRYWTDVIQEICKWMMSDNGDAFELMIKDNPSTFMDEDTAKQYAHYKNFYRPMPGIFVRVQLSAHSTLETVKALLASYDSFAGTETLQSFAFTVQ